MQEQGTQQTPPLSMEGQRGEVGSPTDELSCICQVELFQDEGGRGKHREVDDDNDRGDPRMTTSLSQSRVELADGSPALVAVGAGFGQGFDQGAGLSNGGCLKFHEAVTAQRGLIAEADPIAFPALVTTAAVTLDDIGNILERYEDLGALREAEPVALPTAQDDLLRADLDESFAIERQ